MNSKSLGTGIEYIIVIYIKHRWNPVLHIYFYNTHAKSKGYYCVETKLSVKIQLTHNTLFIFQKVLACLLPLCDCRRITWRVLYWTNAFCQ